MTAVLALAASLLPVASAAAAEPTNMVLVWNENAVNVISGADDGHAARPGPGPTPLGADPGDGPGRGL